MLLVTQQQMEAANCHVHLHPSLSSFLKGNCIPVTEMVLRPSFKTALELKTTRAQ